MVQGLDLLLVVGLHLLQQFGVHIPIQVLDINKIEGMQETKLSSTSRD